MNPIAGISVALGHARDTALRVVVGLVVVAGLVALGVGLAVALVGYVYSP